ncbi:MAG: hypothetical protein HF978_18120 [Desulfobacteraceae bacterium]|nr:SIR2 family protein [Desulfobacteraceae bacterium]MBC2757465.1 hypothetical protein [Desulfobacteraceae bacterium]
MNDINAKQKAVAILADEIIKNRLILFIGAGCSMDAGLPSWNGLIKDLLDKYQIKTNITDSIKLATILEQEIGKQKLCEAITEKLRLGPATGTALHEEIISLGSNLIVTTNYDHLIEDNFRKHDIPPVVITRDEDIPSIDPTKTTIVKLHGDLDSPSSIVITSADYSRYKTKHKGFVDWLNLQSAINTVLFIGTSFDDPRLIEADDHIINIFGEFRQSPLIFLKKPEKEPQSSDEEFEIVLSDFKYRIQDFRDRNFLVIPIDEYDEIISVLQETKLKVSELRRQQGHFSSDSHQMYQSERLEILEKERRDLLDEKTLKLSEEVNGKGRRATFAVMAEKSIGLITHLEQAKDSISPEAKLEGFLTLADTYLNSGIEKDIQKAHEYFKKAENAYQESQHKEKWKERFLRVHAKLLFVDKEIDNAIEILNNSNDPKTIAFRLAIQIDGKKLNQAYRFIKEQKKFHAAWACEAIAVLIEKDKIQEAEKKYSVILNEFLDCEKKGDLPQSDFKDDYFLEKLNFLMAHAIYEKAIQHNDKTDSTTIFPGQLTEKGLGLCKKTLSHIDRLFERASRKNIKDNYIAASATYIEMHASYLSGDYGRADKSAKALITVTPIKREVIRCILSRFQNFDDKYLKKVIDVLSRDYPNASWAWLKKAFLSAYHFKKYDDTWDFLVKATDLASSDQEKEEVALHVIEIGLNIKRADETLGLIDNLLKIDNPVREFCHALYLFDSEKFDEAKQKLNDLLNVELAPSVKSEVEIVLADIEMKEERWGEAKQLLESSHKRIPNAFALKKLLVVNARLQNDADALEIARQLEMLDALDKQGLHIKAQAARNFGQYKISETCWKKLIKDYGNKAHYAYGLAEVMFMLDEPSGKIINILAEYIQCDEKMEPACLSLAATIYQRDQEYKNAFLLIDKCWPKIQNNYQLLMQHMELGYRVDKEKKAHESMIRLEALRKEGKIPDETFIRMDLDQVKDFFKQEHEVSKKLNDQYYIGQIPRSLLCDRIKSYPLYLDWAIRSQPLDIESINEEHRIEFTTYSTNGFRVKNNRIVRIDATHDKEIVIDYHALITLHRLGLLDKLSVYYNKIYYPKTLEFIWTNEQNRFLHHQASEEKAYKSLSNRVVSGQIREVTAPALEKGKKDSLSKRDLRIANLEKIHLVDAYIKKEELDEYPEVKIFRLTQIADWLYARGKIRENRYRELQGPLTGEAESIKENVHQQLDDASRLIISKSSLKQLEKYELTPILLEMGVKIYLEKESSKEITSAVMNIDFGIEVGEWHRELAKYVKSSKAFVPFQAELPEEVKTDVSSQHGEVILSTINYSEQNNLHLLTDDRMMQMVQGKKWQGKQFGTDALLKNLYEKNIISIDQYANCFLKLCRWRYRFLTPDVDVLVYFAKEYQKHPLGKPLMDLIAYCRHCMNDRGLFLGPEKVSPPIPMGVKFYMNWIECWINFLTEIWQDDEFYINALNSITKKILRQAMPEPPSNLKDEIKKNIPFVEEKKIIWELLSKASFSAKKVLKLNGLFNIVFALYQYDEKKIIKTLDEFFQFIEGLDNIENKIVARIISRITLAIHGEQESYIPPPMLHKYYEKYGIIQIDDKNSEPPGTQKIDVLELIKKRKNLPADGPLIRIEKPDQKFVLAPHEIIQAVDSKIRITALNDILKEEKTTQPTTDRLLKLSKKLGSGNPVIWRVAAEEATDLILKDFKYALSLFPDAMSTVPLNQEWTQKAWQGLINPDLNSVIDEAPEFILKKWTEKHLFEKLEKDLGKLDVSTFEEKIHIENVLDWYLLQLGYVPFSPPFNAWNVINKYPIFFKAKDLEQKIEKWLQKAPAKYDPIAIIVALDVILNIRKSTTPDKNDFQYFTSPDFYKFLNSNLRKLFIEGPEIGDAETDFESSYFYKLWDIRHTLAEHYVRYMELNSDKLKQINNDKKVLLAWWLAREVTNTLSKTAAQYIANKNDMIKWFEDILSDLKNFLRLPNLIKYTMEATKRPVPINIFFTLHGKNLLASATTTLIMPPTKESQTNNCFEGMKNPEIALSAEIRDSILEHVIFQALFGYGQIQKVSDSSISLLWNTPACISGLLFLREYYGEAIKYIGKEKTNYLEIAEISSQKDFLKNILPNLPKELAEKKATSILLILGGLYIYFCTHGKLPDEANIFINDNSISSKMDQIDPLNKHICLILIMEIVRQSRTWGEFNFAQAIEKILLEIDYLSLIEYATEIINGLVLIIIQGADYRLLNPVVTLGKTKKKYRKALSDAKRSLSFFFPYLPGECREIARKILNDLDDIPEITDDLSGGGQNVD